LLTSGFFGQKKSLPGVAALQKIKLVVMGAAAIQRLVVRRL